MQGNRQGQQVLLIDDSASVREVLRVALESECYRRASEYTAPLSGNEMQGVRK
jgi:CheY-like chemotaxis protein